MVGHIPPNTASVVNTTSTVSISAPAPATVSGIQPTTTPQVVGNPNASGASVSPVRNVSGLPAGFDASKLSQSMGSAAIDGLTGGYQAPVSSSSFAGYGQIENVQATHNGFSLDVNILTKDATDESALIFQLPLLDSKTGKLTFVNLDLLTFNSATNSHTEAISTTPGTDPTSSRPCFVGRRSYTFSLKQINDFIKQSGLDVEVKPGDRLAISGLVKVSGHRLMNPVSNGFQVPAPLAQNAQSVVGIQATHKDNKALKAQDLPLDITLKLPADIMTAYAGNLRAEQIIEGEITTRLESEYKGSVNKTQMQSMIASAYEFAELSEKALAGDQAARSELDRKLGKGLVLTAVKRHWMCDDAKPLGDRDPSTVTFAKDAQGLPTLDPMKDVYTDDDKLTFCQNSGAVRVRGNAQKAGHAEYKLNGGVLDPKTGIRQRVETGISLKPGATEAQLNHLLNYVRNNPLTPVASSPLGHLVRDAKKAGVLDALVGGTRRDWADVLQIRHKFEVKNTQTGTSAELSLDTVNAKTLRAEHMINGVAQEREYFVVESELDHLQINSANTTELKTATSKTALLNRDDQDRFFTEAKANVASGVSSFELLREPQLHSVEHVKEGSFRQTASYKDFESMNGKVLRAICGQNLPGPARQKSAHFAELLGLIGPEQTVVV